MLGSFPPRGVGLDLSENLSGLGHQTKSRPKFVFVFGQNEYCHYPRRARSALGVDIVLTLDVCLYVCMFVC